MKRITDLNAIRACIFGHAVGDALGVPVEFSYRAELRENPVTDMRGYGTFHVPAGSWSDDTSMSLCALEALAKAEFRWEDVMENFAKWLYDDAFTPENRTFDAGGTCAAAIQAYKAHGDFRTCGRTDAGSNGNGSLMRIIPFALYDAENRAFIEQASALTHAHMRSKIACVIYSFLLSALLEKKSKAAVREAIQRAQQLYGADPEWKYYAPLLTIAQREESRIRSSGYVADTLEAALWCLLTTDSYTECVLKAVNLGNDTDTVAAVAGGLAGALYGFDAIPEQWLTRLIRREYIEALCTRAQKAWVQT